MIFYFSGTGNSKWIANQLSKEQKEELVFIPDALNNGTFEFCLREDEKMDQSENPVGMLNLHC